MKPLLLAVLLCVLSLPMVAQIPSGTSVGLVPLGAENYRLHAESTGPALVDGTTSYAVERGAVVQAGPADGRYQVVVDEGEPNIGGLTGWVDERFITGDWVRNSLTLRWTDNSGNDPDINDQEDGFEVERSVGDSSLLNFVLLATLPPDTETYIDRLVTPGIEHTYRVRAFNSEGFSDYSNNATGMLVEPEPTRFPPSAPGVLELTVPPPPKPKGRLVNISTRGMVLVGAEILIGGFVVSDAPVTVLIRAVGPTLEQFNVPGVLADPQLTLLRGQEIVAFNDNWGGDPGIDEARQAVFAFGLSQDSLDSALLVTLDPGQYTTHLSGVDGVTGVALLEIYAVPNP